MSYVGPGSSNSAKLKTPEAHEFVDAIPGEKFEAFDPAIGYVTPDGTKVMGSVTVTTYRMRFQGQNGKEKIQFDVPLGIISKVEKFGHKNITRADDSYGLDIHCKDMRLLRFLSCQSTRGRRLLFHSLSTYAFPLSNEMKLFAYAHAAALGISPFPGASKYERNGWELFDARAELQRIVNAANAKDVWAISGINCMYEFSPTYPSVLGVPREAMKKKEFLEKVADFRSRQRIPALSWLHPVHKTSITRCAQPLTGVTMKRKEEDEALMEMILRTTNQTQPLAIFDARPMLNAVVNKAKGGGWEEKTNYSMCELTFLDIHNIHVVRESLQKLQSALFPKIDEVNYLKQIEDTKWLQHIRSICEGAAEMAYLVEEGRSSVVVHCSDGWDRTAQLAALALVMLDPYYRSVEGFAILIEKEWCSFGFKFAQRIGHGENKASDDERSPIFVQFMDSVWQLMRQFPAHFEFTSSLLICILDELYSCRFGTFLYNTEKARHVENECATQTVSLWSYVLEEKRRFLNPLYIDNRNRQVFLKMNTRIAFIHVWEEYYARYNPDITSPSYAEHNDNMDRFSRDLLKQQRHRLHPGG